LIDILLPENKFGVVSGQKQYNINSFVLYMLLIQYLQFVVFSQGVAVLCWCFSAILGLICDLHRCLFRLFIFFQIFLVQYSFAR